MKSNHNDLKRFALVTLLMLIIFLSGFYLGFSEVYELAELRRAEKGIELSPPGNPFRWRFSFYVLIAGVLSASLAANFMRIRLVNVVVTALLFASLFPGWTLFSSIPAVLTGPERISPSDFSLVLYFEIFAFPLLVLLTVLHIVHLIGESRGNRENTSIQ